MNIQKLTDRIREYANHAWRRELLYQDKAKWNKMWASMDVIGDTQLAIDFYAALPNFNSNNGGYLYIYGLLQSLFVQQDACLHINNIITGNKIDWKSDYPVIYDIREIRNMSVGHPGNRGNKSFHHISRISISKDSFEMLTYYSDENSKSELKKISIKKIIDKQNELVIGILSSIESYMKSELKNHKKKFEGAKLEDSFPSNLNYLFSKLYETGSGSRALHKGHFTILREAYEKIKEGIVERYASLDALIGIKYNSEMLDYIFDRLERDLINNPIDDDKELYIFVQALENKCKELEDKVKEIDEEFSDIESET